MPRKLQKKLKQTEFYCVECRKRVKVPTEDIQVSIDKQGRPRLEGMDKYNHKLFKYIKFSHEDKLGKKFGYK